MASELRIASPRLSYLPCETLRPADQDGLAVVPVLGLRQQIGGDEFRPGAVVGQHHHLRRACRQVYGHGLGAYQLLGAGDVPVSRAEDFFHVRDAFRAVGHGGHGLRPADGEDAVDAAQVGGEKHLGGDLPAAPGRGAEYDLAAPGDPGGEGEHQHRREERGIAARDVEPHAADGYGTLHAPHAGHHFDVDLRRELCPVEGFDIGLGDRQRRLEPLRHGFGRFGALSAGNLEPLGDVTFDAGHEVAQRLVAARAHL